MHRNIIKYYIPFNRKDDSITDKSFDASQLDVAFDIDADLEPINDNNDFVDVDFGKFKHFILIDIVEKLIYNRKITLKFVREFHFYDSF